MPGSKRERTESVHDDADERIFFSTSEKHKLELTPSQEAKAALLEVRAWCVSQGTESGDLDWVGRQPGVPAVLEMGADHVNCEGLMRVMYESPFAFSKIVGGDKWEHGFHAGVADFARFVRSVLVKFAGEPERALAAVRSGCGKHGEMSFDLYWLGRQCVQEVEHVGPSHPCHSGVTKVLADYPEVARKIADGDDHAHGYHGGVVAFSRLVNSLTTTEWQDFTGNTDDPERPWLSPRGARQGAKAEWPHLGS
jgi:hypothetical protein